MSNEPKFQRLGHNPYQILMKLPDERYISYKNILKISAQADNPFKGYDTSKLSQYVKN